jgi:Skp family chaperone for outer membrane proteins
MKMITKALALATMTLPATALVPTAAHAQVAVANLEQAIQQSAAFQNAMTQMKTTYKTQIDAFSARQTALNAELQPLVTALQSAQQQPNATDATVKPYLDAAQNKRNAIQRELAPLYAPIARTQSYVEEQIVAKLDAATKAAMAKRKVILVVRPEAAVIADPSADMTSAIVAELNTLVPTASITPPAGWQPGQQQQQPQQPQPQGR